MNVWPKVADLVDPLGPTYRDDPVAWAIDHKVAVELWSGQRQILEALRDHPRVAVPTCHTIGKDFVAAVATCWWLHPSVHAPGTAFALTTAPGGAQVRGILWRYIGRMWKAGNLPGRTNLTEAWFGNELVAIGRKPSEHTPTALQGFHARFMLVIFDEACAVPGSLWDAASTLTTNDDARTLAIGNPDDPHSRFAEVCQPGSGWHVIQIGADDTPNLTGEPVSRDLAAELISADWCSQKQIEWGERSPLYISKVKGQFPTDSDDGVIPASWAAKCRYLADRPMADLPRAAGLDIGESGDRTVLYERVGDRAGRYQVIEHGGDSMICVGHTVRLAAEWDLVRIVVDVIGLGWAIYGQLREVLPDLEIARFHAAEQATQPERFINRRAELWWETGRERSRLEAWDLTECDDDTVAELTTPKFAIMDSKGKIKVEAKDEVRKRLGRSPDLADALLMAFWEPPIAPPGQIYDRALELAGSKL